MRERCYLSQMLKGMRLKSGLFSTATELYECVKMETDP